MSHHRAPLTNERFFRLQILQILYFVCQNISKEVCYKDPNLKQKFQSVVRFVLRERTAIHPPSRDKGIRDIEHSMIMALGQGNLFLGVNIDYGLIFGSL